MSVARLRRSCDSSCWSSSLSRNGPGEENVILGMNMDMGILL